MLSPLAGLIAVTPSICHLTAYNTFLLGLSFVASAYFLPHQNLKFSVVILNSSCSGANTNTLRQTMLAA